MHISGRIRGRQTGVILALACVYTMGASGQDNLQLVPQVAMDEVHSVAISHDGDLIATASGKVVTLWDRASGDEVRTIYVPTQGQYVNAIAFSPDGRSILTGSGDPIIRLWDAATGQLLQSFVGKSAAGVTAVAFSSDGHFIVAGGGDSTAQLFDVSSGKEINSFIESLINSVAISSDDQFVLIGSGAQTAIMWNASTGVQTEAFRDASLKEYSAVCSAVLSPDGRIVVTGRQNGTTRLWDAATGRILRTLAGHTMQVNAVAVSPNGRTVLTGDEDHTARLWDMASGRSLHTLEGHTAAITSVAFSADGSFVVTASMDATARLWDTKTGRPLGVLKGHTSMVRSLAYATDGSSILTGNYPGTVRLWDTASGKEVTDFGPRTDGVESVALSPDHHWVLTGSIHNGDSGIWDAQTGQQVRTIPSGIFGFSHVAYSADGSMFLAEGGSGVGLYDIASATPIRSFTRAPSNDIRDYFGDVYAGAISHNAQLVVTSISEKAAHLWDVKSGKELLAFTGHTAGVTDVVFSPDDRLVATASLDNTGRLWDVASGQALHTFAGHTEPVNALAFSSDGQLLLTGSNDGTARLWDTSTGVQIRVFQGHSGTISSVAFSPGEKFVITGSSDSTTRIWDTASGKELARLMNFEDGGWAVVDPNGRFDTNNLDGGAPFVWVVSDDPFRPLPLEIFMREYYTPGLLAIILRGERDELPKLPSIADIKNRVQPEVKVLSVTPSRKFPGQVDVVVHAASQTDHNGTRGDLQDLRLFRDGQMVGSGYVDAEVQNQGETSWRTKHVIGGYIEGTLKDGNYTFHDVLTKSNEAKTTFTAYAFNSALIKSATASLDYEHESASITSPAKPRAYLIQVGVNHYAAEQCELSYSVNDAEKMNADLSERLKAQGYQVQSVKLESVAGGDIRAAGKSEIQKQLAAIAAQATPDDVFFMSFSGHGYSSPDREFYILPSNITGSCHAVDVELLKNAISADDLASWLRPVDAGEMTLILDACFSAESVQVGDFKPGPLGSRGLGQLAYDKRMRVLAASQSDEVAHEYDYLRQGLMTYVLTVNGLDQGKADWKPVDQKIMVGEWLAYATSEVPKFVTEKSKDDGAKAAEDRFGKSPTSTFQIPAFFDFAKADSLRLQ